MPVSEHLLAPDLKPILTAASFPDADSALEIRKQMDPLFALMCKEAPGKVTTYEVNEHVKVLAYDARKNVKDGDRTPALFHIHGGGFICGEASLFSNNFNTADELETILFSVEYRLCPENQYPIPVEDCFAGFKWVVENSEKLKVDPERVSIHGESAGGGLAACVANYIKDKSDYVPKCQVLVYPMLDYKTSEDPEHYDNKYVGEYVWTHKFNKIGWNAQLGSNKISEVDLAHFSPVNADVERLKGLSPTFIVVGALDVFLKEDITYAYKLSSAGVSIALSVLEGCPHAPDLFPTESGASLRKQVIEFFKKHM